GIHRVLRSAAAHRQNFKRAPGINFLRGGQAWLAPIRIDDGIVGSRWDLAIGEGLRYRSRGMVLAEVRNTDLTGRPADARDGVRELDRRIGQEPAPIAGVMRAVARVDDQIERISTAVAEKDRRPVGCEPWTIGSDENVGREPRAIFGAEL